MTQKLEDWIFQNYGHESYHPGLDRINQVLDGLRLQLQKSSITIIAGTNGKGETTHRLGRYLASSHRYCAWTSPHIKSLTERFSSEKGDISPDELQRLVMTCHEQVQQHQFQLTYYEFLFFVFCTWAAEKKPDFLLLEVGLGGRLDAVNSLNAQLVLVTSISRDHQEFLGNRYDLILKEKLGVLRPGCTLIDQHQLVYLREETKKFIAGKSIQHLNLEGIIPVGKEDFSQRNQFLAYAAFCHLTQTPFRPKDWRPSEEKLPSRGAMIQNENQWLLYGSHNVDGLRKLIQFLHSANYTLGDSKFDAVLVSFSKRNEKDVIIMLRMLKQGMLGPIKVTSFDHPKAFPAKELERLAIQEGLDFVANVETNVHGWNNQKILVAGSYYFLGHIQSLFGHR